MGNIDRATTGNRTYWYGTTQKTYLFSYFYQQYLGLRYLLWPPVCRRERETRDEDNQWDGGKTHAYIHTYIHTYTHVT